MPEATTLPEGVGQRKRVTHDDDGMAWACPECDSAGNLRERTGSPHGFMADGPERYACDDCGARFEVPVEREARNPLPDPHAGGKRAKYEELLLDADPDEVIP